MAFAFTEQEQDIILKTLRAEARKCAVNPGVRKTTVEQLAQAADISKGAFYKFYKIKEILFLEVLEDIHAELYEKALAILEQETDKPDWERAADSVLAVCREMEQSGILSFLENDVSYILRKVPYEMQEKHYHSDTVHIKELLSRAGMEPAGGMEFAAAALRGLMLTVSHRDEIGEEYPNVLKLMATGVCKELFPA